MSIEAYALVTFPGLKTDFEKSFEHHMRQQGLKGAMIPYPDPILKLCHIKLVQPLGKNGSCPKPKWEVIEEIGDYYNQSTGIEVYDDRKYCGYVRTQHLEGLGIYYPETNTSTILRKEVPILYTESRSLNLETNEMEPTKIETIDDRRIQLKHIKQLFPECAKMQLAIALDYVRDRI